jgi:transcriptional regulator with XRE-family HTH domain
MTDIGKEIRRLRKERKMTQQTLAAKAGISGTTLWQAETGRTTPRLPVVEKIAAALGVDSEEILFPKAEALKFQPDVDEGSYDDFRVFLGALDLDGLNLLSTSLREEFKQAVIANDLTKAEDLYSRLSVVSEAVEEHNPPLANVKLSADGPAEVTFYREPTQEQLQQLEEQHPGFVVVATPVAHQ